MPTITERRRRALRPVLPIDDLFESLDAVPEDEREEMLFERASYELETGRSRKGMYAMALTAADGNRNRAQARYLRLRVDQLACEFEAWEEERENDLNKTERLSQASADFLKTVAAVVFFVLAVIALVSWN